MNWRERLNPALAMVGLRWQRRYLGLWGQHGRRLIPIGWRIVRASDPVRETELDRLVRRHRER